MFLRAWIYCPESSEKWRLQNEMSWQLLGTNVLNLVNVICISNWILTVQIHMEYTKLNICTCVYVSARKFAVDRVPSIFSPLLALARQLLQLALIHFPHRRARLLRLPRPPKPLCSTDALVQTRPTGPIAT